MEDNSITIEHVNIANANLHEPKGVSASAVNKVYVADGAGSGTWQQIEAAQIDSSSIKDVNRQTITVEFTDISTAGSVWVNSPFAGDIVAVYSVIDGVLATADAGMSLEIGGTAVTGGGWTIAFSGSAAGDSDTTAPSAANTLTVGQAIEVISDGASTNTVKASVTLVIDVS